MGNLIFIHWVFQLLCTV